MMRQFAGLLISLALVATACVPKDGPPESEGSSLATAEGKAQEKAAFPGRDKADLVKPLAVGQDPGEVLLEQSRELDMGSPQEMDEATLQAVTTVMTDPGELPRMKIERDGKSYELPLKHTHVDAKISGYVARVSVVQTYQNPFPEPIETVYVFPLPENSAVDDMKFIIGDRTIESDIQERQQARETYEAAKAEGHTAALLEQERPNIFTQSVANIAPGEDIDVVITYVQNMSYDGGEYEWVFPMVVGPRFIPGAPSEGANTGTGWAKDTAIVGDASRITPPIVGGGMRSGHDISLALTVDAGFPIDSWSVPTHEVAVEESNDQLQLALAEKESLPNRDFVLRYSIAAAEPQATILAEKQGEEGFFTLIVQPPELEIEKLVGERELLFVVDVSGSMSGKPLAMCQDAMILSLRQLRPNDTFNIMTFSGGNQLLWPKPYPANDTNIKEAMEFVTGMRAGGGTQINDAIKAALEPELESNRNRYVFFMTDGYVGDEERILNTTRSYVENKENGRRRVFGFGVGSSVNTYLLDGLGDAGEGATVYSTNREDPARAVNRFYGLIDHPVIENITIDWGGMEVSEVVPEVIPDLFASRPFVLQGRYAGSGVANIVVSGTKGGENIRLPLELTLPPDSVEHSLLATLWARAKVTELERDLWDGEEPSVLEAIREIGLSYRIVTRETSFVAVDRSRKVGDGNPETVVQPVDGPEDVNIVMAGAPSSRSKKTKPKGRRYHKREKVSVSAPVVLMATEDAPAELEVDASEESKPSPDEDLSASSLSFGGFNFVGSAAAASEELVKAKFKAERGKLQACLNADSVAPGRYKLQLKLDASGQVISVNVGLSKQAANCMEALIKLWQLEITEELGLELEFVLQ